MEQHDARSQTFGINPTHANSLDDLDTGGYAYANEIAHQAITRKCALNDAGLLALKRMLDDTAPGYVPGIVMASQKGATLAEHIPHAMDRPLPELVHDPRFDWGKDVPLHPAPGATHVEHDASDVHPVATAKGRPKAVSPNVLTSVPHGVDGSRKDLEPETAFAYEKLLAHARAAGFAEPLFDIVSGFRSDEHQQRLWEAAVRKHGSEQAAQRFTGRPGGSKHRSGKAIDFWLGEMNDAENVEALHATAAYRWLAENASHFGFNPYPVEPWHWEHSE